MVLGTINNKSQRNDRGKCLGWPVTSYGGDIARQQNKQIVIHHVAFGTKTREKPFQQAHVKRVARNRWLVPAFPSNKLFLGSFKRR